MITGRINQVFSLSLSKFSVAGKYHFAPRGTPSHIQGTSYLFPSRNSTHTHNVQHEIIRSKPSRRRAHFPLFGLASEKQQVSFGTTRGTRHNLTGVVNRSCRDHKLYSPDAAHLAAEAHRYIGRIRHWDPALDQGPGPPHLGPNNFFSRHPRKGPRPLFVLPQISVYAPFFQFQRQNDVLDSRLSTHHAPLAHCSWARKHTTRFFKTGTTSGYDP
jgi:hypothetical protein